MQKLKILIIEDEEKLRENICELLTLNEFKCMGAPDGEMGLKKVHEFHPDLVLCDIRMPGKDGYWVLKTVRDDKEFKTLPFIFISAKAEKSDQRLGMDMGADDYLTKPFTKDELLSAVRARLARKENFMENVRDRVDLMSQGIGDKEIMDWKEKLKRLTKSEIKILRLIAANKTSKQIAEELFVSFKTVENHRSNISRKLELQGTLSLVTLALKLRPLLQEKM